MFPERIDDTDRQEAELETAKEEAEKMADFKREQNDSVFHAYIGGGDEWARLDWEKNNPSRLQKDKERGNFMLKLMAVKRMEPGVSINFNGEKWVVKNVEKGKDPMKLDGFSAVIVRTIGGREMTQNLNSENIGEVSFDN